MSKDSTSSESPKKEETKFDALGFKQLYCGPDPVVDIVAIHGLNSQRETAWTDAKSGTIWIKDLLPKSLEHSRILTYGYDADTHASSLISVQTLAQHGRTFAEKLAQERLDPDAQRRPIIFIAHDLGGIVLKHALAYCNIMTHKHLSHLRGIKVSTFGILFFGTPHMGANDVDITLWLVGIYSVFMNTNKEILKHLSRNSEHLTDLAQNYLPISADFHTIFFWEAYPTKLMAGNSMVIVPRNAAVIPILNARDVPINRDHVNMVKFTSEEDPEYVTVSRYLIEMVKDAPSKIVICWKSEDIWNAHNNPKPLDFNVKLSLPFDRNSFFTGRETELSELDRLMAAKADRRATVLFGLSGMGKTEIALEFAYRTMASYTAVLWIDATTKETIDNSFYMALRDLVNHVREEKDVVQIFDIPNLVDSKGRLTIGGNAATYEDAIRAVKNWLSIAGNDQWLAVFDNVDDVGSFEEYISRSLPACGSYIITSQMQDSKRLGTAVVDVGKMDEDKAMAFLLTRSKRNVIRLNTSEVEASHKIVNSLGGFPLALEQAAAYIQMNDIPFTEYHLLYVSADKALTEKTKDLSPSQLPAYVTWELSSIKIGSQSPKTFELLLLYGYMSSSVRDELIKHGKLWTNDHIEDLLQPLLSYSLLKRMPGLHGVQIHPFVHSWSRFSMHNAEQQTQTLLATRVLSRAFQNADMNEEARFLFQKRLLPDLLACFRNIQAYILNKKSVKAEALDDVKSLADVLQAQGFQAKAEGLYDWVSERISKVVERQSPPHPSQAEESPRHTHPTQEHKRQSSPDVIYHIYQPISGPQPLVYSPPPPPTPSSRQPDAPKSRIVYVPYATADTPDGVYGSSKPMKQVPPLPSQETNTDEEGPGLVILRDLVSVYLERKEYAHASETLTRLLSTQVLNHGEKSKNVVGTRRLLEEVRHMTEDAVDPISPLKASRSSTSFRPFPLPQYLEPSRFLHSPSPSVAPAAHIDSSTTAHTNDQDRLELLRDLGEEYLEGQDYAHAEEVFKRLYNAEVSALGPRDPSSLATAHKLATILVNRGNYTSAERKFTQILSAREEVLGKQHADTLDTQRRIQELRSTSSVRQDNAAAANPQPLASPIGTQQELNNPLYPGDPPALEILHANAVKLFQEGHIDHAYQLADYVLLARQKVLGPQHPLTLETLNLAETIRLKGEQACNILGGLPPPFSPSSQPAPPDPAHQASHVEPLAPEPKPPSTPKHRNETSASLTVLHENAVVLRREGKQAHAKALLEYVLVERQKLLGPQHPDTLETLKCLEASIGNVDDDHPTLAPSRTTRDFPHPRAPLVPASTQSPAPTPQSTNQKPSTLDKDSDPVTKERKETPASLKILHDNAVALMNKGEDAHAIELFKYVYLERQKVLRPQHPDTLETLKYLEKLLPRNTNATVYIDSSIKPSRTAPQPPSPQASLAPPSSTSSPNPTQSANPRLDANDRVLESPGSLDILHANAVELAENGNLSHAEELFEYVLSSRQRILGGRHPATLETQKSLTDVQRKLASPASSSHTSRTAYSSLPFFTRGHSASAPPSQSSRSAYRPSPTSPAAGPTPYTTGQIRQPSPQFTPYYPSPASYYPPSLGSSTEPSSFRSTQPTPILPYWGSAPANTPYPPNVVASLLPPQLSSPYGTLRPTATRSSQPPNPSFQRPDFRQEDPMTLQLLQEQALKLADQGDYRHAEEQLNYVLEHHQGIFGPTHPVTYETLGYLEDVRRRSRGGMSDAYGRPTGTSSFNRPPARYGSGPHQPTSPYSSPFVNPRGPY